MRARTSLLGYPFAESGIKDKSLVPEDKHPGRWASSKQITLPCWGAGAAENTGVGGERGGHRSVGTSVGPETKRSPPLDDPRGRPSWKAPSLTLFRRPP